MGVTRGVDSVREVDLGLVLSDEDWVVDFA